MPRQLQHARSRSLAIYEWLLGVYPRAYLRRHRQELLQNFQDMEQEFPSKAALWSFVVRDLIVSLHSEVMQTFWGQTTIVFTILSLILAVAHRHPGKHEPYIWSFCFGYTPGWIAGWFGWTWRMSSCSRYPNFVRSFRGQAAMFLCAITVMLATATLFPGLHERFLIAACYGAAHGWITGWGKNKHRITL